jgi:hypothetical protein
VQEAGEIPARSRHCDRSNPGARTLPASAAAVGARTLRKARLSCRDGCGREHVAAVNARAAELALGVRAGGRLVDPACDHRVALFGCNTSTLERLTSRNSRLACTAVGCIAMGCRGGGV